MQQNGPWTIKKRTEIYSDSHLQLYRDEVIQPDGSPGHYTLLMSKAGVAVLPVDDEANVYLVRQFRYALGQPSVEAIAGGLDSEDDDPQEAAQRELEEEAGIRAGAWTSLGMVNWDTSKILSPAHLFLARKLTFTEADQESTEEIQIVKMPLVEAVERVMNGSSIIHGVSCVLILKAARVLCEADDEKG